MRPTNTTVADTLPHSNAEGGDAALQNVQAESRRQTREESRVRGPLYLSARPINQQTLETLPMQ